MQNKILLSLAIVAVLALDLSAQNQYKSTSPYPSARLSGLEAELTRFLESDEETPSAAKRPRVVAARPPVHANTVSLERVAFNVLNQKRAENECGRSVDFEHSRSPLSFALMGRCSARKGFCSVGL